MKITKLTKEQQARKKEIKDYWINLALYSGDEINKKDATEGIQYLYHKAGLKKPKVMFLSSPLGIQIAINILKNKDSKLVSNEVSNELWNEVEGEVWNEVRNEVEGEVGDEVWNEVWNEVGDEVWNEVWDEVEGEVSNEVWNEVGKQKLKFYSFNYQNLTDIGWVAFHDFFINQGVYSVQTEEAFLRYKKYLQSGVFFSVVFNGVAFLSRRPKAVRKNPQGRLHSETSPAIEWRDGYKIYALNGVRFSKDLWVKITSEKLTPTEFFAIKDIDQRTQALKFMGYDFFIKEAKGEKIDEYIKYDIDGNEVKYELYKFEKGKIFTENAYYCLFDCPSTRKKHFEGVEKSQSVPEAMAWAETDEALGIIVTPEMWKLAIPLKEEN